MIPIHQVSGFVLYFTAGYIQHKIRNLMNVYHLFLLLVLKTKHVQSNCTDSAVIFCFECFYLGPTCGELQRNPPKVTNGCHSPKRVVASLKTIANKLCRQYDHLFSWLFFSSMKTQRDWCTRSCLFFCWTDKPVILKWSMRYI